MTDANEEKFKKRMQLCKNKLQTLEEFDLNETGKPLIGKSQVTFFSQEGTVVVYWVAMGIFDIEVKMYNFSGRAPDKQADIGKGAFGIVRTDQS
jgi:hypothetical protein